MCQLPLPVAGCQLPHLSCHLWVCYSCRVIEICAWALRQMPKEWQWYLQHTHTHTYVLVLATHTCHTCGYVTTFTWSLFKMQHALSELSNFVYFSSTSSLSLPQSQAQQNHSQKSHTHTLPHTHCLTFIIYGCCKLSEFVKYAWIILGKSFSGEFSLHVCVSLSLSCNLWHSLLLWQVDLISKFVFDLGNLLPSSLVAAWIYDLSSLWHQ